MLSYPVRLDDKYYRKGVARSEILKFNKFLIKKQTIIHKKLNSSVLLRQYNNLLKVFRGDIF